MAVYLLRNYAGFTASSTVPVTFPDSTEASLIAQGLAIAANTTSWPSVTGGPDGIITQGGNVNDAPQAGYTTPTYYQGPLTWSNIALGSLALTSYETNGVAQTAGTWNLTDIYVPYYNTWTGVSVLQGTTVGTNLIIVALFGSNGTLIANSTTAGVATASASTFKNCAFTAKVNLVPGRYIIGVQLDGNTDTIRHVLSANGAANLSTGTQAGTFATVPSSVTTIPVTFTTAQAPIVQLYT